jgi:hypothetical protein
MVRRMLKVHGVWELNGRGLMVALADKAFAPGEHETLELGTLVRRASDGAQWEVAAIERGARRTGGYLLKGIAEPREGDDLEMLTN